MPYVILYKGTEYNDEIYSVGGGSEDSAKVYGKLYNSVEEARHAVRMEYYNIFEPSSKSKYGYSVGEFSYDNDELGWDLAEILWPEKYDDRNGWNGPNYGDLIREADNRGIEWLKYVPQLYEIIEVA